MAWRVKQDQITKLHMPGWKKKSSKKSYKKKSSFKKRKPIFKKKRYATASKKRVYARRKAAGVKRTRKTVKLAPTAHIPADVLGLNAGFGDSSMNGAVGSWSRARGNKPFSDRFFCKDRWVDQVSDITFNLANSPSASLTWVANGLFDPQFTSGLQQRTSEWFATLGEVYLQYRVHACSIYIDIDLGYNDATQAGSGSVYVFGLFPSLIPGASANAALLPQNIEQLKLMPNVHLGSCNLIGNKKTLRLKHYMKLGDLLGIDNIATQIDMAGDFVNARASQTGTNPGQQVYWILQGYNTSNMASGGVNYSVVIKYDVECFELLQPDTFNGNPGGVTEGFEEMKVSDDPKVVYPTITTSSSSTPTAATGGTYTTVKFSMPPPLR